MKRILWLVLVVALAACTIADEDDEQTPTPESTITPIFITATPGTTTDEPAPTAAPANAQRVPTLTNCSTRTDWPQYTVEDGDTLGSVARDTGSSVAALATANCLSNANVIYIGQPLRVPSLPGTDESGGGDES